MEAAIKRIEKKHNVEISFEETILNIKKKQ